MVRHIYVVSLEKERLRAAPPPGTEPFPGVSPTYIQTSLLMILLGGQKNNGSVRPRVRKK